MKIQDLVNLISVVTSIAGLLIDFTRLVIELEKEKGDQD